jgi:hypothetical protein
MAEKMIGLSCGAYLIAQKISLRKLSKTRIRKGASRMILCGTKVRVEETKVDSVCVGLAGRLKQATMTLGNARRIRSARYLRYGRFQT